MLTRRETLRGGTAAVAAIACGGAVAAAGVPAAVNEPLVAMADELRFVWHTYCTADEDDPTRDQYVDRFNDLFAQVCETPARSLEGILAKYRAHYSAGEEERILAGKSAWDSPDEDLAGSIYRDLVRLAGEV